MPTKAGNFNNKFVLSLLIRIVDILWFIGCIVRVYNKLIPSIVRENRILMELRFPCWHPLFIQNFTFFQQGIKQMVLIPWLLSFLTITIYFHFCYIWMNFDWLSKIATLLFECEATQHTNARKHTRGALKVMPSIVLCWPTTLAADVSGIYEEVEPSRI